MIFGAIQFFRCVSPLIGKRKIFKKITVYECRDNPIVVDLTSMQTTRHLHLHISLYYINTSLVHYHMGQTILHLLRLVYDYDGLNGIPPYGVSGSSRW